MPKETPRGNMPSVSPQTKTYICTCCGKSYTKQNNNFMLTNSPLYANNSGFLPFCKTCSEKYYQQLLSLYDGDPVRAIKECCHTFGWYWNMTIYNSSLKVQTNNTPLVAYYQKLGGNDGAPAGYNFINTIQEDEIKVVNDEIDNIPTPRQATASQIKRWGVAFETDEYEALDNYYADLTSDFESSDPVQDKLIQDLCVQRIFQDRAIKRGDYDTYEKASKLYHSTLKAGNLEVRDKGDTLNDPNAAWGQYISIVENYTPAEYYKDKSLFKDFDSIKEYFERFIVRPFKNFFTGQNVMDPEYSVNVGDTNGDADDED